jgi:hypothetical protein
MKGMILVTSVLLYGDTGSGKSALAMTSPTPILLLDAEMNREHTHRYVDGAPKKIVVQDWNPDEPYPDVEVEVAATSVRSFDDFEAVLTRLNDRSHPFKTVVVDSITEIQNYLKTHISLDQQLSMKEWGQMQYVDTIVKRYVDLPDVNIVFVALTQVNENGQIGPALAGRLKNRIIERSRLAGVVALTPGETQQENDFSGVRYVQKFKIGRKSVDDNSYFVKSNIPGLVEEFGAVIDSPNLSTILNFKL